MPTALLEGVKILRFPTEVRFLPQITIQMQASVHQRSSVWQGVARRIRDAATSDDVRLDTSRNWHEHSTIGTLQRTNDWLNSIAPEFRSMAIRGDTCKLIERGHSRDVGMMEAIREVLERRGRR